MIFTASVDFNALVRLQKARNRIPARMQAERAFSVAEIQEDEAPVALRASIPQSGFAASLFLDWRVRDGRFLLDLEIGHDSLEDHLRTMVAESVRRIHRAYSTVESRHIEASSAKEVFWTDEDHIAAEIQRRLDDVVLVGGRLHSVSHPPVMLEEFLDPEILSLPDDLFPLPVWKIDAALLKATRIVPGRDRIGADFAPVVLRPDLLAPFEGMRTELLAVCHALAGRDRPTDSESKAYAELRTAVRRGESDQEILAKAWAANDLLLELKDLIPGNEEYSSSLGTLSDRIGNRGRVLDAPVRPDVPHVDLAIPLGTGRGKLRQAAICPTPVVDPEAAPTVVSILFKSDARPVEIRHDGERFLLPLVGRTLGLDATFRTMPAASDVLAGWEAGEPPYFLNAVSLRARLLAGAKEIPHSATPEEEARMLREFYGSSVVVLDGILHLPCEEPRPFFHGKRLNLGIPWNAPAREAGGILSDDELRSIAMADLPIVFEKLKATGQAVDCGVVSFEIVLPDLLELRTADVVASEIVASLLWWSDTRFLPDHLADVVDTALREARLSRSNGTGRIPEGRAETLVEAFGALVRAVEAETLLRPIGLDPSFRVLAEHCLPALRAEMELHEEGDDEDAITMGI